MVYGSGMAALDLFFSPEDRHRVILLQQVLEDAGVGLRLHTETFEPESRPVLGVLSEHVESWMVRQAIASADELIWLRLDNSPLPAPARQALALQNWPGRSADLAIAELVEALRRGWQPPAERVGTDSAGAEPDDPIETLREPGQSPEPVEGITAAEPVGSIRRGAAERAELGGRLVGLLIVLLIVAGFWSLSRLAPASETASEQGSDAQPSGSRQIRPAIAEPTSADRSLVAQPPAGSSSAARKQKVVDCMELAAADPDAAQDLMESLDSEARLACRAALGDERARDAVSDPLLKLCLAPDDEVLAAWVDALEPSHRAGPVPDCLVRRAERSSLEALDFARSASRLAEGPGA